MKGIKIKATYEAIKLAQKASGMTAKLGQVTAGNKKGSDSADVSRKAVDEVLDAAKKTARMMPNGSMIRGRKRLNDAERRKDLGKRLSMSPKWVKTSDMAGKRAIRTAKTRIATEASAEHAAAESRARGTAIARKAFAAGRKKADGIKAAAVSVRKAAGRMLRSVFNAHAVGRSVLYAGGAAAMLIVTVISMVGGIAASPFGVFFSIEEDGGEGLRTVVADLSKEFYDGIRQIQNSVPHDIFEIESDNGMYGVQWDDILPLWAVYRTVGSGRDVVELKEDSREQLREMMKDLTSFSYEVSVAELPAEEEKNEESDEEEDQVNEIRTLTIRIQHGSINQYTKRLGFTEEQYRLLSEIQSGKYRHFWAKTAGAYAVGGQIFVPFGAFSGLFAWPLSIAGSITSGFGYRADPFTGEQKFHGGIDIAAAKGTPVLASSDGFVTVANGTDPWGGGYGYYVMVSHGNGYETLYGHCSAICAGVGQAVSRGEVIAYVGSTGNSTGNHLHFEVRNGGQKMDPMQFYQ